MILLINLALLGVCLLASGVFSGSETGIYSLSNVRVEMEAQQGMRSARRIQRLLRDQTGLVITLLIANNLVNQASTYLGRDILDHLLVPVGAQEVVLTLLLTPVLFLCGELLPKDYFRRRPHNLVGTLAPLLRATQLVTLPFGLLLRAFVLPLERLVGLELGDLTRVRGREERMLELLREHDVDRTRTERMARNVLGLRSLRVDRVMVPWARVHTLAAGLGREEAYAALAEGPNTRVPVCTAQGQVEGYVHQLEVLSAGPGTDPAELLRPMLALAPEVPLDRALARLQAEGQRMALVGSPEQPLGLVTVKDLVEEISGELARW